jgi:hypothetical protein
MPNTSIVKAGDTKSLTLKGSITIKIGSESFTLEGTVGNNIIVEYHADFDKAINLGSITEMGGEVAQALGVGDMAKKITDEIENLKNNAPPILADVIKVIDSPIRITDLVINTQTNHYAFGFALDFTTQDIKIGNIQLMSFGLLIDYSSPE